MRILAIERELSALDPQKHGDLLREEAAFVWALKKKDVIRDIWFTRADNRAILMLECESADEAVRQLKLLPLVREHFIDFEVLALRTYDGFDRLIKASPPNSH